MKPMAVVLTALLMLWAVPLGAHERHGEISILTGTVRTVEKDRIEVNELKKPVSATR